MKPHLIALAVTAALGAAAPAVHAAAVTDGSLGAVQSLPPGVYIAMNGRVFDPAHAAKNRERHCFEETD